MLRRLRAALGIGVTWALGWGAAGGVLFGLSWLLLEPYQRSRLGWANGTATGIAAVVITAGLGMIGGVLFATLLGLAERRGNVDQLSVGRVALLGAAGGLGLQVATSIVLGVLTEGPPTAMGSLAGSVFGAGMVTAFGAASAAATLGLARRASLEAPDVDLRLPEARA